MTKLTIDGKEVRADLYHNCAVYKSKGWRVRHHPTGLTLGDEDDKRVFDSKEHAERFAWAMQERLELNVKSKEEFLKANGNLTFKQYCDIANEEFERSKI